MQRTQTFTLAGNCGDDEHGVLHRLRVFYVCVPEPASVGDGTHPPALRQLADDQRRQCQGSAAAICEFLADSTCTAGPHALQIWHSPAIAAHDAAVVLRDACAATDALVVTSVQEDIFLMDQYDDESFTGISTMELAGGTCDAHHPDGSPTWAGAVSAWNDSLGYFYRASAPSGDSPFKVCCRVVPVMARLQQVLQRATHSASTTAVNIILVTHAAIIKCLQVVWLRKSPEWHELEPTPPSASVQVTCDSDDVGYIFGGFRDNGQPLSPFTPRKRGVHDDVIRRGDRRASGWSSYVPSDEGRSQFSKRDAEESTPLSSDDSRRLHIILVRSAGSLENSTLVDSERALNDIGRCEAHEVGHELRRHLESLVDQGRDLTHVRMWVSPYRRARETAEKLLEVLNPSHVANQYVHSVRESIFLSERLLGLAHHSSTSVWTEYEKARAARHDRADARFWYRPPYGESLADVSIRMGGILSDVYAGAYLVPAECVPVRTVILVTHGDVIPCFVAAYMRYSPDWFSHEPTPPVGSIQVINDTIRDEGYTPSTGIRACGLYFALKRDEEILIPQSVRERTKLTNLCRASNFSRSGSPIHGGSSPRKSAAAEPSSDEPQAQDYLIGHHTPARSIRVKKDGWSIDDVIEELITDHGFQPTPQFTRLHASRDIRKANKQIFDSKGTIGRLSFIPDAKVSRRGDPALARWSPFLPSVEGFSIRTNAARKPLVAESVPALQLPLRAGTLLGAPGPIGIEQGGGALRIILVRHGFSEGNNDHSRYDGLVDAFMALHEDGRRQAKAAGKSLLQYLESTPDFPDEEIRMWVSPFLRTRETATAIIRVLNSKVGKRYVHSVRESAILSERDWGYEEGEGFRSLTPGQQYIVNENGATATFRCATTPNQSVADFMKTARIDKMRLSQFVKWNQLKGDVPIRLGHELIAAGFGDCGFRAFYRSPNGESLLDTAARMSALRTNILADAQLREPGSRIRTAIVVTHGAAIRAFLASWFRLPRAAIDQFVAPPNCAVYVVNQQGAQPLMLGFNRREPAQSVPQLSVTLRDDGSLEAWAVSRLTAEQAAAAFGREACAVSDSSIALSEGSMISPGSVVGGLVADRLYTDDRSVREVAKIE